MIGTITRGMKEWEFSDIPKSKRKKLITLMARISERSYRRGFQHGKVIEDHIISPEQLRWEISDDKSPYTDSKGGHSAIDRLFMEYREIECLGLFIDDEDKE